MDEKVKDALEDARHELTTLHGLVTYDGAAPNETWSIDCSKTLAKIDEALELSWAVFAMESGGPRQLTLEPMSREKAEWVRANYEESFAADYESFPPLEVRLL